MNEVDEQNNTGETLLDERPVEARVSDGHAGLLTLVSLVLIMCALVWLKGYSILNPPQRFNVLFPNVAGLNVDGTVYVDGLQVGAVEKMKALGKDKILVGIRINADKIRIPIGSKFQILTNGVVGAKYVDIDLPDQMDPHNPPKLLDQSIVATGEDPVRPEVVINNIAASLRDVDFDSARHRIDRDFTKLTNAADHLSVLSSKLEPAADQAAAMELRVGTLAQDLSGTTHRLNKILNNPALTTDLRQTAEKANQLSENILMAMREFKQAIGDDTTRSNMMSALEKLNASTADIRATTESLTKLGDNSKLRSDMKEILTDAQQTMNQANELLNNPNGGTTLKQTLSKTESLIGHLDTVSIQMHQILDRKHPLVHLLFGRPGHVKEQVAGQNKTE